MTDISYRVVPRGKSGFDVEMDKPDGRKQTVPGFRSEHEAEAWIVQAKRMIRDAGPWTPLAPRKSVPAASSETAKPAPPGRTGLPVHAASPAQTGQMATGQMATGQITAEQAAAAGQTTVQDGGSRATAARVRVRPVRERSEAQG